MKSRSARVGLKSVVLVVALMTSAGLAASVAAPTVSPATGTYSSAQKVTLSCSTAGATIRYTTSGSDPTTASAVYSGALTISSTSTLKAKAFKSGMTDSTTATATYTINLPPVVTVTPSLSTVNVGNCLYFTGTVTQGGKPASGVSIGVNDPMKQQCIANAATTDSNGKFTYYPENMCPAKNNNKAGVFQFTFSAGSSSVMSQVTVSPVNNPQAQDAFTVNNTGKSIYKVNLLVNNQNKGTTTVSPGAKVTLFSSSQFANSTILATIMDNNGKTLWKTTVNDTHSFSPPKTVPAPLINPTFGTYLFDSSYLKDKQLINTPFRGVKTISDALNQNFNVAGVSGSLSTTAIRGVDTSLNLGLSADSVETFAGARLGCSLSCGASVGLEVCFAFGAKTPVELGYDVGCGFSCCFEVATVSATLVSANVDITMQK